MQACDSTSKRSLFIPRVALVLILGLWAVVDAMPVAQAQDVAPSPPSSAGRTVQPEEDDFAETPYTRYGEFDNDDEEEELRYMQYGRFFGVSLGVGYEGALGNKGDLYSGGFPAVELKVLYWFDFNFALSIGVMNSSHSYSGQLSVARGDTEVKNYDLNLFRFGIDLRYYFDVTDSPAAITFANPFVSVGVHSYTRNLTNANATTDKDTEGALGYSAGLGAEFTLKPKKTYFNLEARLHQVNFSETKSPVGLGTGTDLPNQSGPLYSVMGSVLFTW